jgi:transposase
MTNAGGARVRQANREQLSFELVDLEALLPQDHRVRLVWAFVAALDITSLYAAVKARGSVAGRPVADPKLLLGLWLYATTENIGSARELERRVARDIAYRWMAGGVSVNYHQLAEFRVDHGDLLDRLLTESVTALLAEGLLNLDEMIADGTKVQAAASHGSYGRRARFERLEKIARDKIATLRQEVEMAPGADLAASAKRVKAARERAARALLERAQRAKATLEELQRAKAEREKTHSAAEARKEEPKVSLTDPEAQRMRFADGAVKPGYNMQAVTTTNGFVLEVDSTARRNDTGLAVPMMEMVKTRYKVLPKRLLVDTKYAVEDDIVALAEDPEGPVMVYAPVPDERPDEAVKPDTLRRRKAQRETEHPALKDWRQRMDTSAGQDIFRKRRRIETTNAWFKNHGLARLTVRGLKKARIIGLWHALAHNIMLACFIRKTTNPVPQPA